MPGLHLPLRSIIAGVHLSERQSFSGMYLPGSALIPNRPVLIERPTLVRELDVWPQGEQLLGPGPTDEYLDILDGVQHRRIATVDRIRGLYVSRVGIGARALPARH